MKILLKALVAPLFVLATMPAFAQANTVEVAAGGGWASYHNDGSVNKGKFDASVSYNALSNVSIGFEYGFSPLQDQSIVISGTQYTGTEHLNSYGAVSRIGLLKAAHIEPYVLVAGGGFRDTLSVSGGGASASQSQSGGYFGTGGGVSAYLTPHIGVRPEVRYQYLHVTNGHLNELDITGSIFYTFGGSHKR